MDWASADLGVRVQGVVLRLKVQVKTLELDKLEFMLQGLMGERRCQALGARVQGFKVFWRVKALQFRVWAGRLESGLGYKNKTLIKLCQVQGLGVDVQEVWFLRFGIWDLLLRTGTLTCMPFVGGSGFMVQVYSFDDIYDCPSRF